MAKLSHNEELNKYLHTEIMGECWHDFRVNQEISGMDGCWKGCGCLRYQGNNPDYCTDLNAVAKVERKVIEEKSAALYGSILLDELGVEGLNYNPNISNADAVPIATAPADVRARACKEAWDAKE